LRDTETTWYKQLDDARNMLNTTRKEFKQKLLNVIDSERSSYKVGLQESMDERGDYRESIVTRKEKEKALTDMLSAEKIDITAL